MKQVNKSFVLNPFALSRLSNNILIRQYKFPFKYPASDKLETLSTNEKNYHTLFERVRMSYSELDIEFWENVIPKMKETKVLEISRFIAKQIKFGEITGYRITRYTEEDEFSPYYVWELYHQASVTNEVYSSSESVVLLDNMAIEH